MYLDLYRGADAEDSFDHFDEQRETNIEFLRAMPRSAGGRKAMHKVAGEITLQQMLHEWAMHDLGTFARLPSWCVRANTGRRRGDWGSFISLGREKHRSWRSRLSCHRSVRKPPNRSRAFSQRKCLIYRKAILA
jgi:hypothetical protein